MTVAARRGAREQAPQVPSGRIVLQPPPEITPSDGASGLLLQAVPMVGSLGTIGFVAMSQSGPRAWFTAGMFLLASVGFVLASGVRQRQQHTAGVARGPSRVPRLPRRGARHHPGRRRAPARGGPVGLPRPRGAADHRGRGHPGVGAHRVRRRLPPGADGRHVPAAVPHPRAARDPAAGPARPGGGLGAAPPALDPPGPARAAGIRRAAGLGARRGRPATPTRPARSRARSCCRPRCSTRPRTSSWPRSCPASRARSGSGSSGCRTH